ncbi:MAG: hypothetical protein ACRBCL_13940 [Maritimibacter sp.]
MSKQLNELARITQIVLDAELAQMQGHSQKVNALEAKIAALKRERNALTTQTQTQDESDTAMILGLDRKWQAWAQLEQAKLNRELAAATALLEAQREKTRVAFGRAEAVKNMQAKQEAQSQQKMTARHYAS